MAVFLVNICKFQDCSQKFSTLRDLIHHIEEVHIPSDPTILEKQELQQPSSLPLSYILRLFESDHVVKLKPRQRKHSISPVPSLCSHRSSTPTGSEFDDDDRRSEAENSDDSWTNQEEFTSEIILSMMGSHKENDSDKPFVCPVPGCKKRYKNINGIKYHARHGHRKDLRVKKPFRCVCGKSYRSSSGLRNHSIVAHHRSTSTPSTHITSSCSYNATRPSLNSPKHSISNTSTVPLSTNQSLLGTSLSLPIYSPVALDINPHPSSFQATKPVQPKQAISVAMTSTVVTKNCVTVPIGAIFPKAAGSNRAAVSSLLPSQNGCATLPPGTLTFASPTGGVKVAVPVSKVIQLPTSKFTAEDRGMLMDEVGLDVIEPFGALETVETFSGLETSVDDTKAD